MTLEAKIEGDYEQVFHPKHYGGANNPYEAIKVIAAWLGPRGVFDFDVGNALKYICRAGAKPSESGAEGLERDLRKADWYLNHAINLLQNGGTNSDADYSTTKEQKEAAEENTHGVVYRDESIRVVVDRLLAILTTCYGPFISMLSNTAHAYKFKKGDKEVAALLDAFGDACRNFYVSETGSNNRAKEEGVLGKVGVIEEGCGVGESTRVGGTE